MDPMLLFFREPNAKQKPYSSTAPRTHMAVVLPVLGEPFRRRADESPNELAQA